MQLEPKEPAHCWPAHFCQSFEHFIPLDPFVIAYADNGRINKAAACALAPAAVMQEHHERHRTAMAYLYRPVVRNHIGEAIP